jgi:hypothetical protein
MLTYIAQFTIRLQRPIATAETSFPELRVKMSNGYLREIVVRVLPADGVVRNFAVKATYSGEHLIHYTLPDKTTEDGIWVGGHGGLFVPPWEAVQYFIQPILYHLSGFTLQAHVYWDIEENLPKWVSDFHWVMPDGRTVPSLPPEYPGQVLLNLRDAGERLLTLEDWRKMQEALDGSSIGAPLWRLLLADAHRERSNDLRNVVVRCAMALDVAAQPLLPANKKFDMSLLQGTCRWARTPDLRVSDPDLCNSLLPLVYAARGYPPRRG